MEFKRVFLLIWESIRYDHLSISGYRRETTPNLKKILNRSLFFKNHFTNGPNTPSSLKTIFTSTYPLSYQLYGNYPDKIMTLPRILKEKGFINIAIHNSPMLSKFYGWNRDFDVFYDFFYEKKERFKKKIGYLYKILKLFYDLYKGKQKYELCENAEKLNEIAVKELKRYRKEKVFLWLHYLDTHIPYTRNPEFLDVFGKYRRKIPDLGEKIAKPETITEQDIEIAIDLYDAKIRYLDNATAKFFNKLEDMNILKDSLFIITTDHGEEFREHGDFSHKPKLYDELLKIFLLIFVPSINRYFIYNNFTQHLDIMPTILDFLNIEHKDIKTITGFSLKKVLYENVNFYKGIISEVANTHGDPFANFDLRKYSYRGNLYKYICDYKEKKEEFFNILDDPVEKKNILKEELEKVKAFRYLIDRHQRKQSREIL